MLLRSQGLPVPTGLRLIWVSNPPLVHDPQTTCPQEVKDAID